MDPTIRPSMGKSRVPTNRSDLSDPSGFSSGLSGISEIRGHRPVHSAQPLQTPFTGPRPIISLPITSTQPLQSPVTVLNIPRPPRQLPPRAYGVPQQRTPRPYGPRSVVFKEKSTVPKQDPMTGVRIF